MAVTVPESMAAAVPESMACEICRNDGLFGWGPMAFCVGVPDGFSLFYYLSVTVLTPHVLR